MGKEYLICTNCGGEYLEDKICNNCFKCEDCCTCGKSKEDYEENFEED